MGRILQGESASSREVVRPGSRPTRRRPQGYYSLLEVATDAGVSEIDAAYKKIRARLKLQFAIATSSQQRSAVTVRMGQLEEAHATLSERPLRQAYDRDVLGVNPSTARVKRMRAGLTLDEREEVSSRQYFLQKKKTQYIRKKAVKRMMKKKLPAPNLNDRVSYVDWRMVTQKGVCRGLKIGKWGEYVAIRRSRKLLRADRRLNSVAVVLRRCTKRR